MYFVEVEDSHRIRAVYGSVQTPVGKATLRDLIEDDLGDIVRFWYESGDSFLDFLGIDRRLLGSAGDTRQRFSSAIRTGDPNQPSIAFAISVDETFAGYTLLNRYTPEINYSHWHITNPGLRGSGLSTALYPHRIKMYFDLLPLSRLIHQTRTRNIAVDRMLNRYVPVAETVYIERPDGVALPGEFHLRYVHRGDIPGFFKTAEGLRH